MCQYVCSSIFVNNVRTAGPIVTGEAPIDALIRRNDEGDGRGSIGCTWHVARAVRVKVCNKDVDAPTGQTGGTADPKLEGHTYTTPSLCAIVVSVPVGCRLHAPEAENFFDIGSSSLRKL